MPRDLVRRALRWAGRASADTGGNQWRYRLGPSSTLVVSFERDSVAQWILTGQPTARIAEPNFSWSLNRRGGFPERVVSYLAGHHETLPRVAFAMYRACPAAGMTTAEVRASWGAPNQVGPASDATAVIWTYGYGVEGQREVLTFVRDSLIEHRTAGWR